MKINGQRLIDNLNYLKTLTDTPGEGVTRFSYGKQDLRAREYIIKKGLAAGCSIEEDPIGNLRIGLKGNLSGRPSVIAGSHIDTVRNGGWLDGIYGVCGALEAMETLAESGLSFECNYEMVIFAEEEGSNFGSTMTGSKFITGLYDEAALDSLRNDTGQSLRDILLQFDNRCESLRSSSSCHNTDIDVSNIKWDFSKVKTMLELHIEQGPVLHRQGLSLGIVDSIFGMRVIEVTLGGVGNHAGATPMEERFDALNGAARCILKAEEIVKADPDKLTVATIGKLNVTPNCSNVIPETVKFSLEVRHKDKDKIDLYMEKIKESFLEISEALKLDCNIREHSKSSPLHLTDRLIDTMVSMADSQNLAYRVMDSGAVHDACMIARLADTGMIFVPSIDGRSHVPEENTNEEDLKAGAQFLLDIIIDQLKEG